MRDGLDPEFFEGGVCEPPGTSRYTVLSMQGVPLCQGTDLVKCAQVATIFALQVSGVFDRNGKPTDKAEKPGKYAFIDAKNTTTGVTGCCLVNELGERLVIVTGVCSEVITKAIDDDMTASHGPAMRSRPGVFVNGKIQDLH